MVEPKSQNIFWTEPGISLAQRELRHGHRGCVVWLTGLSGAGKSTLAVEIEKKLFDLYHEVYVLDGDKLRHGLNSDLGFAPDDRRENIRRVGETAKLMAMAGVVTLAAFISPYRADRDIVRNIVRNIMPDGRFIEVHVKADLATVEQRDTKGLYAKARAGLIKGFTGISAPYEPPIFPEVVVDTSVQDIPTCVTEILSYIKRIDSASTVSVCEILRVGSA